MSLSSDNREKDLETIRDSFETLLPWVGANFYYYRHLVQTVIRLIDRRQLEGVCCMFTSAYHEVQRQAPVHHFYQENYIPEGSKKGGVDYFSVIGKPILDVIMAGGNVRLRDVVMPVGLNYLHDELNDARGTGQWHQLKLRV